MKRLFSVITTIAVFLLISNLPSFAQYYVPDYLKNGNTFIEQNFQIIDSSGWFYAKRESNIPFTNFLQNHKSSFGMGSDDNFILSKATNDDYPFMTSDNRRIHHRYNQTYKNVKVEYAELFLHHQNDRIELINCKLAEGLNMSVIPALTEVQALTYATNYLGAANLYTWQDSTWEADYKDEKQDSTATTFPTGDLIIAKIDVDKNYSASQFVLAWKFSIQSISPEFSYTIYINAANGNFIKKITNYEAGSADLTYGYGLGKWIDTKWRGGVWNHFILHANDIAGRDIYTKKTRYTFWGSQMPFGGNNTGNSFDSDDTWYTDQNTETTPHWAITQAWDYFKNTFNRNSIDNAGKPLKISTQYDEENAFFNGDDIFFIGSHNGNHLGTIDICGHEYFHGITKNTANLVYEKEPGALNESFSDIFGFEVERYTQCGNINDWDMGEDAWLTRRMNHPSASAKPQPSVYLGTNWYVIPGCVPDTSNDYCGVHKNSGVQNYWFYLLTQGSNNAPDGTYNNISVSGIGADKARNITYYSLDNILGKASGYNDAANGAKYAANVIFGMCSEESHQTQNAWAAVGLGTPYEPFAITGPGTIYHFQNGTVLGGMPKLYSVPNNIGNNIWTYAGPWTYFVAGWTNNVFMLASLNNNFNNSIIQVTNNCGISLSKSINFVCLDCPIVVGGNPTTTGTISLYPNPAKTYIKLKADFTDPNSNDGIVVSILDMQGVQKFQQTYEHYLPASIDINNFVAGTYIAVVQQGSKTQSIRFVKE